MMMWAFNPSAATASDATNTSGLGSGFSSGSQSNSSRSYLKLIICSFLPNSCPHTKFHPNWTKNIEVKMISYWLASVGWSGRSKNSCILFKLILFRFQPNISSETKSNQNRMKNAEVEKIRHWSALVGQLGRSKNSRGHLKLILCCSLPDIIHHIKFHLNRMKNTEVPIFEIFDPQIFFENSAKAKLSKLEPFAWSHWIRNCLNYSYC